MTATDVTVTVDLELDAAHVEPCSCYWRSQYGELRPCPRPGRIRIFVRCRNHDGSECTRWLCLRCAASLESGGVNCGICHTPAEIVAVDQ